MHFRYLGWLQKLHIILTKNISQKAKQQKKSTEQKFSKFELISTYGQPSVQRARECRSPAKALRIRCAARFEQGIYGIYVLCGLLVAHYAC